METTEAYDSPLEVCILKGDLAGVMDLFDAMTEAQRAASLVAVERLSFDRWRMLKDAPIDRAATNLRFRAIDLARFLCLPEHPRRDYWMHIGVEDIAGFRQRYGLTAAAAPTAKELRGEHGWHYGRNIHRAIIAGLVERPDSDEYRQSFFFGDLRHESNVILKHVDADPAIAPYLLALFDHEGTAEGSFAAVEKYCHDPQLYWSHAFLTLCERGVYTREQLLDKTLSTLASDFPQFKAGWFSNFHTLLAPTVDEMAAHAARYLALCHSRIAPTVSLAMNALTLLYKAGHVSADDVCESMPPVLSSPVKARVLSALALLGQVVKQSPAMASRISAMAVHALAHSGADVQKKTIGCLQAWKLDDEGRDVARTYLPFVAAVNQAALLALLGESAAEPSPAVPAPAIEEAVNLPPLDPARALAPVTTVPDLIERIAFVFEHPTDVDEWERVAEALVRMAPIPAAERPAFKVLQKRAARVNWFEHSLAYAIVSLLACVADLDTSGLEAKVEGYDHLPILRRFILWRADSLLAQAAAGQGLTPLSSSTHKGGFIDPRTLVARTDAHQKAGADMTIAEQVFALMRLVPASMDAPAASAALASARSLQDSTFVRALRYALGDAVDVAMDTEGRALFLAAARIRTPAGDDAGTLAAYGCLGPGGPKAVRPDWHVTRTESHDGQYIFHYIEMACQPPLQVPDEHHHALMLCANYFNSPRHSTEKNTSSLCFSASLLPSDLEPLFAQGARALCNNRDWWEAEWHNRIYLDLLLQPTTAFGPMARLVLAFGLAGKEPGQKALAVDGLVSGVRDRRLNVAEMGETLARLWATPLVTGARLAKTLGSAAQAHAALPGAVLALLCAMLEADPDGARKDKAVLLELLLELKLSHRLALPASTAALLGSWRLSGKSKQAVQGILAGARA